MSPEDDIREKAWFYIVLMKKFKMHLKVIELKVFSLYEWHHSQYLLRSLVVLDAFIKKKSLNHNKRAFTTKKKAGCVK